VYGLLLGTKDSKKARTRYSAARKVPQEISEAMNYTRCCAFVILFNPLT